MDGAQLTRRERKSRAEAIRGSHHQRLTVACPSQICESGVVQIADNTQRFRLLCVVHVHSILSGNGIDNTIRQTKCRHWSCRRLRGLRIGHGGGTERRRCCDWWRVH